MAEFIECDCGTHAISVDSFDGEVTLSLWEMGDIHTTRGVWLQRLRTAWAALNGRLFTDSACLNEKESNKLITHLVIHHKLAWPNEN